MRIQTVTLLVFTLLSCKTKPNPQFQKDIVGEWVFARIIDNRNKEQKRYSKDFSRNVTTASAYTFFGNNTCENKRGYFTQTIAEYRWDRRTIYLGSKTDYKIEGDSLKILDLSDGHWDSRKIAFIKGDTLTFQSGDSSFTLFARAKYKIDSTQNFDKIIVSSSGCYGSCLVSDISLDKEGNVLFFGEQYATKTGFFHSKISVQEYQNFVTAFKKADILSLNNKYEASWTDDETISITFIKDGRIVKSVSDYGREAPQEFIWAYTPVRYLYQHLKLVALPAGATTLPIGKVSLERGNNICHLTKAESFYLSTMLFEGAKVSQNVKHRYKIRFWNSKDEIETVYTDGRFYEFSDRTIDIGSDFLTRNDLDERFRKKEDYEK